MDTINITDETKCYFFSPTHCNGQKEEAWGRALDKGIIAMSSNPNDYTNSSLEEIEKYYESKEDPESRKKVKYFELLKSIRPGDVICCKNVNHGLFGIGVALSSYKFDLNIFEAGIDDDGTSYYHHYIEVNWICKEKISSENLNIEASGGAWEPYGTVSKSNQVPKYIINYLKKQPYITMNDQTTNKELNQYIELLKANKNLILTGAPGTGKTHLANEIAKGMGAKEEAIKFVQFHPSYDYTDFVEGLRPTKPDVSGNIGFERVDGVFKAFCKKATQAPEEIKKEISSEIIEGCIIAFKKYLKENGRLSLETRKEKKKFEVYIDKDVITYNSGEGNYAGEIKDDKMKKYLDGTPPEPTTVTYTGPIIEYVKTRYPEPRLRQKPPFVFIIDEVNRGEISKIFGELFFSIDPGYRGKADTKYRVQTQYQNMITDESDPFKDGFYVPENVYIIGTMNDIDRSVESMDFAMRRRFAWKEVKASENVGMLDDLRELKGEVINKMDRLNKEIETVDGLSPAYHIGGAYFKKLETYLNEDGSNKSEAYKKLWENHLEGLLRDYLRGSVDAEKRLDELKKTFENDPQ